MKILLLVSMVIYLNANYQGKIDMHGGKKDDLSKKNIFLDKKSFDLKSLKDKVKKQKGK